MGCDYFPYFSGSGRFFSGGLLSIILWAFILLIAVLLVMELFRFLRSRGTGFKRDREDSLDILKARYARGELDRAQYLKMKETLFPP
jgi:putative membrane protein